MSSSGRLFTFFQPSRVDRYDMTSTIPTTKAHTVHSQRSGIGCVALTRLSLSTLQGKSTLISVTALTPVK
eukprot:m.54085 g.54085  ORF g.54085 m.54085 type:complete len:70 (-) comp11389_c0_seq2:282-491(-)